MDYRVTIEPVDDRASASGSNISEAKAFPAGTEEITFGRERTNALVFPPEARIVSRNHGRLYRQRSGDYAIEAFGDHYIEIDGYPAERGQSVKDGATIRLGGKDGPAIRVRVEAAADAAAATADGGKTLAQKAVQPVSKSLARLGRYQLIGLAAILIVAAAVAFLYFRIPSLETELAALRDNVTTAAEADFVSTDALRAAAYAVILRDRDGKELLQGTAWVYGPAVLVTNAHVAALFDRLRRGEVLLVRPPASVGGEDHIVTASQLHPGYLAFKAFLQEAEETSTGFRAMTKGLVLPSAYDVGALEVENGDTLGPALAVADGVDAESLAPGASLAYAGYPVEGVATQKSAQIAPNPQLQFGAVTSLTDYFLFGGDAGNAFLVQNSLPATGGASGSPVVDRSGKVVAVLSGGTVIATETGRTPSAVLINYAQRADLIAGALDPSTFDLDAARAAWLSLLARFDAHEAAMIAATKASLAESTGNPVGEADLVVPASLQGAGAVRAGIAQYRIHHVEVKAGRTYTFLVYGDLDGSLSLALFRDGKGIDGAGGGRWFSTIAFTADKDETLELRVIGEAANPIGYKLYVFSAEQAPATAAVSSG
jgi:hypothetical protein